MFINHYYYNIVKYFPNRLAVDSRDNPNTELKSLTYQELENLSSKMAQFLRQNLINREQSKTVAGLEEKDIDVPVIAIHCSRDNPIWIVAIIAIWKIGGTALLLDQQLSDAELVHRFQNVNANILFSDTEKELSDSGQVILLNNPDTLHEINSFDNTFTWSNPKLGQLAYIAYTSGSTGRSKAVAISYSGISSLIAAHLQYLDIQTEKEERLLQNASFSFDACWMEFFLMLAGVSLVLVDINQNISLSNLIVKRKISLGIFVPSVMRIIERPESLTNLRAIVSTGEAGDEELFARWLSRGEGQASRRIIDGYGPTECTVGAALRLYEKDNNFILGKPIDGYEFALEEITDSAEPFNADCKELLISGIGLAQGYVRDGKLWKEENSKSFFYRENKRYYRTGDVVTVNANNELTLLGRKDRQVKMYGMRVQLEGIEAIIKQIFEQNSAPLRNAYMLPYYVKTDYSVKPIDYLIALFVVNDEHLTEARNKMSLYAIRQQLRSQGVHPAALPKKGFIVPYGFLQTQQNIAAGSKIKIGQLIQAINTQDGLYTPFLLASHFQHDLAKVQLTKTERQIQAAWNRVLNSDYEEGSINPIIEEFEDIGGNSLTKMQLLRVLEKEFNVDLSVYPEFPKQLTLRNIAQDIIRRKIFQQQWIKINNQIETSKIKLFWFHPAAGTITEYIKSLKDKFDNMEIYAFGSPWAAIVNLKTMTLSAKEELAEYQQYYYCTDLATVVSYAIYGMKRIQPIGPYAIAGFSLGGVGAFEMGLQLQRKGQKISWMGLLDPPLPDLLRDSLKDNFKNPYQNFGIKNIILVIQKIGSQLNLNFNIIYNASDTIITPEQKIRCLFSCIYPQIPNEQHKVIFKSLEENLILLANYRISETEKYYAGEELYFYISNQYGYPDRSISPTPIATRPNQTDYMISWERYINFTARNTNDFLRYFDSDHISMLWHPELCKKIQTDVLSNRRNYKYHSQYQAILFFNAHVPNPAPTAQIVQLLNMSIFQAPRRVYRSHTAIENPIHGMVIAHFNQAMDRAPLIEVLKQHPESMRAEYDFPGFGMQPHVAPLIWKAAERGWTDVVRILLQHGVDPNSICEKKTSCIVAAGFNQYLETIKLLVGFGAKVQANDMRIIEEYIRLFDYQQFLALIMEFFQHQIRFQNDLKMIFKNNQHPDHPIFLYSALINHDVLGFSLHFAINNLSLKNTMETNSALLKVINEILWNYVLTNDGNQCEFCPRVYEAIKQKLVEFSAKDYYGDITTAVLEHLESAYQYFLANNSHDNTRLMYSKN